MIDVYVHCQDWWEIKGDFGCPVNIHKYGEAAKTWSDVFSRNVFMFEHLFTVSHVHRKII